MISVLSFVKNSVAAKRTVWIDAIISLGRLCHLVCANEHGIFANSREKKFRRVRTFQLLARNAINRVKKAPILEKNKVRKKT